MKKLTLAIFICVLIAACNNAADGGKTRDTVSIDVSTHTSTESKGDTSSYDRMSNKTTDSTQQ